MKTEADIIYLIHEKIRAGEINADDTINERLMRGFLSEHRGKIIEKNFNRGEIITDEMYQDLGEITFSHAENELISSIMPKIIRLKNNFGIRAWIDDYSIAIVDSGEYKNSKKDKFNKYHPMMKFVNDKLYLSYGQEQSCSFGEDVTNSALNRAVRKLRQEITEGDVKLNVSAVLVNPDDQTGYDFTSSYYPLSDELIQDLINSVSARDFNIFLKTKADETADMRSNVAEYNTREEL
jgi:hypothetical protein